MAIITHADLLSDQGSGRGRGGGSGRRRGRCVDSFGDGSYLTVGAVGSRVVKRFDRFVIIETTVVAKLAGAGTKVRFVPAPGSLPPVPVTQQWAVQFPNGVVERLTRA